MAHQSSSYECSSEDETIRSRNERKKSKNSLSSSQPSTSIVTLYSSSDSHSSESEDEKASDVVEEDGSKMKERMFDRRNLNENKDACRRRKERCYRKRSHSRSRSISPSHHKSNQRRGRSESVESHDHQPAYVKSEKRRSETEEEKSGEHDDAVKPNGQRMSPQSPSNIVLPSYYNRKMINPKKYAEQIRKRKLLWGRDVKNNDVEDNHEQQTGSFWQKATFNDDENGRTTAKFKRLMGIRRKNNGDDTSQSEVRQNNVIEKQKEIFDSMESQYEAARVATHTHRGVGLGFGIFPFHTQQ